MADAVLPAPQPPAHVRLRPADLPYWDTIIDDLCRQEWTPQRLLLAAQLARTMADIATEQERLDAEPSVIRGAHGTLMANPRLKIIDALIGRMVRGIRQLGLHHRPRPIRRPQPPGR